MRVRTDAKREEILEAAHTVFMEQGYSRATMADIAARMGGSKATLYGYFQAKPEIFEAVVEQVAQRSFFPLFEGIDPAGARLRAQMQGLCEGTLELTCAPGAIRMHRTIVAEAGEGALGLRFFQLGPQKALRRFAELFEQAQAAGRLGAGDPALMAVQLFALLECETLHPCVFGLIEPPDAAARQRAASRALDTFWRAYGPALPASPMKLPASKKTGGASASKLTPAGSSPR